MELVMYFQKMSTSFLSFLFSIFDAISGFDFFLFVFAILFLVLDKQFGYKYFLSLCIAFFTGTVVLKNIIKRLRPYELNSEIITERNCYGYSLPSNSCALASSSVFALCSVCRLEKHKNNFNKFWFGVVVFFLAVYCIMVGLAKIYFADNFLLDVILGLCLGLIVSYFVFRFVRVNLNLKKYCSIILGISCIILFCFYAKDLYTNSFDNSLIFEFCGLCLSILIGTLIEEKFIKYEIKNNLILVLLKVFILILFFLGFHFLTYIIPGLLIFSFLKTFLIGLFVTIIFPLLFSWLQNNCYVFSSKVDEKRIVKSAIVLNEKGTIKFCKQITKYINSGDCILFDGEMGAGKSFVVRAVLNSFGVGGRVTSPTFTLFNDYKVGNKHFYHFDLYRLDDEDEVTNFGFEEIVDDKSSIKFIEWPEKALKFMPNKYKKITIVKLGKKMRNIIFEDYSY